jgi:hypothetical protein
MHQPVGVPQTKKGIDFAAAALGNPSIANQFNAFAPQTNQLFQQRQVEQLPAFARPNNAFGNQQHLSQNTFQNQNMFQRTGFGGGGTGV